MTLFNVDIECQSSPVADNAFTKLTVAIAAEPSVSIVEAVWKHRHASRGWLVTASVEVADDVIAAAMEAAAQGNQRVVVRRVE